MKIRLVLDFGDVDTKSERAMEILSEVCEACETMRIAFNAEDILINSNISDED